jgi:GDPmannose 4,6-dehydratase
VGTRVLITGITGQDGSYLVDRLVSEGADVWGLVRPGDAAADAVRAEVPRSQLLAADLADPEAIRLAVASVAAQEVYHLAGISSVAQSWREPVLTAAVTATGAAAVMHAALEANSGCRIVLASSAEIFAGEPATVYDEESPISPANPYGAAKAYAHQLARVLREQGGAVSATVLFNHESPRRPESFVTRKITAGAARISAGLQDTLTLGNLEARRDWGWAPDYVDAMLRANRHAVADEYVVATGTAHSVRDFALLALEAAGIPDPESRIEVDPELLRGGDAPALVGNPAKARTVLGWEPTLALPDIVREMVAADVAALARA